MDVCLVHSCLSTGAKYVLAGYSEIELQMIFGTAHWRYELHSKVDHISFTEQRVHLPIIRTCCSNYNEQYWSFCLIPLNSILSDVADVHVSMLDTSPHYKRIWLSAELQPSIQVQAYEFRCFACTWDADYNITSTSTRLFDP